MTSPSTPRDRVETGAQASGGDDVDDERDAFYAGEADDGDTSASELSDARAALEQAEADMVTAVERARVSPLTGEDIQKVIDAFRAARDRVTQLLRPSYADAARPLVAEKPAAPENAHAGMKRGSDVARRFTGEDTHPAPEERRRDGVATPMDVDDDGAFAGGQATRAVYDRASAIIQACIEEGSIDLDKGYGTNHAASRAWLTLQFMRGLIEPIMPEGGRRIWDLATIKKFTSRQKTYLRLRTVGCVNKAPFAACGALSSGILFVHTHSLARDLNMVEEEGEIDPSLVTTNGMLDKDKYPVETAKVTYRFHEHFTDQNALAPIQVNMFDFAPTTKEEFENAMGVAKYRRHPKASKIVADAGSHEAIMELLRDPLIGDVVFVAGAALDELIKQILPRMRDMKIIWFGDKTARLAFPELGMNAFSFMKPESTAFGIMFCETTGAWRNFMCVHGYGTLNGYTANSQGEPGMADNMRALVRAGDWFRFMRMKPICADFRESPIWRGHFEELNNFAVKEEKRIRLCHAENKQYVSRPRGMSIEGGKKSVEARRSQPATGKYAGAPLVGGGTVVNQLQAAGKHTAETLRGKRAIGEYAGAPLVGGGTVVNQLQAAAKHMAETMRDQPATGPYAGAPLVGGGTVVNQAQAAGKKLNDEYGSLGKHRTKPWVSVRASRIMNGEDHEFAVFDGSFLTTVDNEVASAKVLIQKAGNKENYMKMLDKYDEDKQELKNPVDFPESTFRLSFATEMKLEDIVNSLAECAPNRPVRLFRRGWRGRELTPDQATNWKFEVIGYLLAETRIAETMAAAAEGAKDTSA